MDNEIAKLGHSAFVGGKEALAALIEIAESRIDENPKLSAEAYREVAAAYKHQVFVMAATMEGMQGKMDYEIAKLADSAVIGNKEGLDKLIAIAESSFAENPGRSAEAYRGVVAVYKQQMVELSFESRESKGKIARLEQFKSYVEAHKHLLEVKTVLSGPSPTFAEFSQRLECFPNDAMTILWFVSCLPETDSLLKLLEDAQVTENWATVFTIVKPLAFSWVVSHFSAPPTDEESRKELSEVSHCFDPNRVTVLSDLVGLWPLLQLFEQKEQ